MSIPAKYDRIGIGYNRSRQADPYLTSRMAYYLQLEKGKTYLDIGCGTGNYSNALWQAGLHFIGIDPSEVMLARARQANSNIVWQQGQASQTGLADNCVDGILASLTTHHWPDLQAGFTELHRVLKAGGRLLIFTATPAQMEAYWLNHYFPETLRKAMVQMPSFEATNAALIAAGFKVATTEKYFVKEDLQDLFLQSGKHRPELYFSPEIRSGISTFATLTNSAEVEQGLANLREDIDSGRIRTIISSYEGNAGDYLFLLARS